MHIYRRWLASRQMLVDMRDAVQKEVARGVTEDQAVAVVPWPQYEKMQFLRRPKRDCCPAAVSATDRRAQVTGEMKKAANPDYLSYASLKKFAQRSARKSGGLTPVCSLRTMPNDEVGGPGDDDSIFVGAAGVQRLGVLSGRASRLPRTGDKQNFNHGKRAERSGERRLSL